MYELAPPFRHTSGPYDAKVVIVGEAWGEQEALTGLPFIGASGQELTTMLQEAGFRRRDLLLTNVLNLHPPRNDIEHLCASKKEVGGANYTYPPLRTGKYLRPEFLPEIDRLKTELNAHPRNLIIALGNTACWALFGSGRISSIRGSIAYGKLCPTVKVLPTYHPAAVLRNWSYRPVVIADLMKARREVDFPEIRRPERQVLINPTLSQIYEWAARPAHRYAVDIETSHGQITMIGFARSPSDAIVIPFWGQHNGSYWPTTDSEIDAWTIVDRLLGSPAEKIFQNGLYDLQYLLRMGLRPHNCIHDTMLLHHSLYPELPKGLGFLGSIYSNEASWKLLREDQTLKRDE